MTAENTPDPSAPDTVVLIHELCMTLHSWEKCIGRHTERGCRVLGLAYPGLEVEAEALREDLSPIEPLTMPAIVEHYRASLPTQRPFCGRSRGWWSTTTMPRCSQPARRCFLLCWWRWPSLVRSAGDGRTSELIGAAFDLAPPEP